MANTDHIITNRLREDVWRNRKIAAGVAAVIVLILTIDMPGLWWLFLAVAVFAVFQIGKIKVAGAEGEEKALRALKGLPATYTLFNQLDIPSTRAKYGSVEADLVVVGPNGVFVIEVKHNKGTIYGENQRPQWRVEKVGRQGGEYETTMRNPIRQLGGQIGALKDYFRLSI